MNQHGACGQTCPLLTPYANSKYDGYNAWEVKLRADDRRYQIVIEEIDTLRYQVSRAKLRSWEQNVEHLKLGTLTLSEMYDRLESLKRATEMKGGVFKNIWNFEDAWGKGSAKAEQEPRSPRSNGGNA